MDLWIRSNDGVLFEKAEMIKVANIQDKGCNGKLTNFRYGIVVNNDYVFAEYKSKERALEVLDEIQNLLKPQTVLSKVGKPIAETCDGTVYREPDEYDIKELSTYVYEMPEE